jgi:replication fork clamp-binding protein CrfC
MALREESYAYRVVGYSKVILKLNGTNDQFRHSGKEANLLSLKSVVISSVKTCLGLLHSSFKKESNLNYYSYYIANTRA